MMRNFLCLALLSLLAVACNTDMVSRIKEDEMQNGGYIRTVSPYPVGNATFSVSKANMGGTKMELVAEAVTPNQGALFSTYELSIKFIDATPANGSFTTAVLPLKTLTATTFTKDATTGYPRSTITVTGTEALTATKLTEANVSNGDRFEITGTMRLTDGKSFSAANTGANITGGAFYSSPFVYRLNVVN